jgi:hypothetical protein
MIMSTKLRVKLGALELEYEGTEEFVSSGLMPLIEALQKIEVRDTPEDKDPGISRSAHTKRTSLSGQISTSTIAQKTNVRTGAGLSLAAVAYLVLVQNKPSAERIEILKEMQSATAYYKDTYSGNLTATLKRLVTARKLNDLGANRFTLHAHVQAELVKTLAQ